MQKEASRERRSRRPQAPFKRPRKQRPGFAEHEARPRLPKPKGEIPPEFATNTFGKLYRELQHALAEEGYRQPTPIQERSIPHLLEGRDLLGCAQTGTGKTAAFLLPILQRLAVEQPSVKRNRPRVLILAPTRELAAQIAQSCATYSRYLGTSFAVVFGGVSQVPQVKALNRGAAIVVATPGRLLDLLEQGHIVLGDVREFVLDEADRMLDMGFLPDIKRIIARLPQERQTQFFSATLTSEVLELALELVRNPVHITISPEQPTVDKINQKVMFVEKKDKIALLGEMLVNYPEMSRVVVFARTRYGADKIVKKLLAGKIDAAAIHSDKSQFARTGTLNAFKEGRIRVLVATDIASRGIDVDGVTHVINHDLPQESESYIHRIGRTARAGAVGAAISFVSASERGLLLAIERLIRKGIEVDAEHAYHSADAQRAAGKGVAGEAPPWVGKRRAAAKARRSEKRRRVNHAGRHQSDFRKPGS